MVKDGNQMEIVINSSRLDYLLDLYKLSREDVAERLSKKGRAVSVEEIAGIMKKKKAPLSLLKKIDALFERGLNWYAAERELPELKSSSIFFRKDVFNTDLNFEARKITSKFEEKKFDIQNLSAAINFNLERKLEKYTVNSNARTVAKAMRERFESIERTYCEKKILKKPQNDFDWLKTYAAVIENMNVFVFEYLENWNKKEKTNFNGFFMQPNIIVIKGQKYRRREIFTLMHEFAHYLLEVEEIDDVENGLLQQNNKIEKWCNDFAYYFLIGDHESAVENMGKATADNHFQKERITEIYGATVLSRAAIYTRLKIENKISQADYEKIIQAINDSINRAEVEKKMRLKEERDYLKEQGKKIPPIPKRPLQSRLFREIVKINYFEGNLNEVRLCDYLNIKADKVGKEIY